MANSRFGESAWAGIALIAASVIALDIATKALARQRLDPGDERWLIDGWVGLDLTSNRGVAFGIGSGSNWTTLLVTAGIAILVALAIRAGVVGHRSGAIVLALGLGGAIGNLVDRLPDGAVTDFVAIGPWPRFNVADSALTLGLAGVLFVDLIRRPGPRL